MTSIRNTLSTTLKRVLAVLPLLVLILMTSRPAAAQRQGSGSALERLRARAPGRVEAERSPGRDRIRSVRGDLTPPSAEAPRDVALRFLAENAELFEMSPALSDLRLERAAASPAGRHLRFAQSWRGLLVFDHGADVHVAIDGRVVLAHNDYVPGIDLSISPGLSVFAAAQIATRDYLNSWRTAADKKGGARGGAGVTLSLARPIAPELGIYAGSDAETAPSPGASPGPPRLAWRVTIVADAPQGATETILDARSGSVLRRRSLVQDSHLAGRGRVFDPSPANTLHDTTLRDGGDADGPVFSAAYRIVPLPGLSRAYFDALGPLVLMGPYVRVNDLIERPFNLPTYSGTGDFFFGRDRLEFENVMVYFHLDRSQRYIQSLGFTDVNNRPIRVDPHGLDGADNSHYVGFPFGAGWIAFGEGGVDDAEDADVILHEYGHAIQDNSNPAAYSLPGETGAQGEGFGDYWAFTSGPTGPGSFDPACIAEWDFAGTCLRRVDGTKHYPENITHEVHADGEIWSSALHEIHLAVGRETTDAIVLQSHFLVPLFPKFCDGARALRDADVLLYAGAHAAAIGGATARRGIAGDFTVTGLSVAPGNDGTDVVHFAIVNRGPCALGPAVHVVRRICPENGAGDEAGRGGTDGLAPGQSASFDVTVAAGGVSGCFYRVVADAESAEIETDENNNIADAAPVP